MVGLDAHRCGDSPTLPHRPPRAPAILRRLSGLRDRAPGKRTAPGQTGRCSSACSYWRSNSTWCTCNSCRNLSASLAVSGALARRCSNVRTGMPTGNPRVTGAVPLSIRSSAIWRYIIMAAPEYESGWILTGRAGPRQCHIHQYNRPSAIHTASSGGWNPSGQRRGTSRMVPSNYGGRSKIDALA